MLVEAASRLNVRTRILDKGLSPAKQINASEVHVDGSFTDYKSIKELALQSDVLTVEIEHVDVAALEQVRVETGIKIYPLPETIRLIQDKYLQKEHLIKHDIQVVESVALNENSREEVLKIADKLGFPLMLKSRTLAYDGRGNFVVKTKDSIEEGLEFLKDRPLYAEKWCPFVKELAVMVVRSIEGEVFNYPIVETIHKDNICHLVYCPAPVNASVMAKAEILARNAIKTFPGCGIFGIEMFVLENGELLINEIAPRPHNSGHYTIDSCVTSQFEAHIRAITNLPLPKNFTCLTNSSVHSIMLNVLGDKEHNKELQVCRRAMELPNTSVYLYGKTSRPQRKMGHINVVDTSISNCERKLDYILGEATSYEVPVEGDQKPLVSIVMGSDSDLVVMSQGADILKKFGVPFELTIVSAHRTPIRMQQFAMQAQGRGIKCIIAGAGGAAHLPGMVAALTSLPVIGVPVKGSTLDGVDSLHSIVQMPRGIPVATVAINNSTNAALLAIRILGTDDEKWLNEMNQYMLNMESEVLTKVERLERVGYEKYFSFGK
ncbi:Phosphoribosylaminoimidazole carboxylase [Yamadazyma tenuis ATCC 10573]|uniref:Phosphoribosylaminoimidazole carboxylase n=2 Tax=Candida tenuis TaxID=2315449 RepID=G3B3A1_CANTC|nr:Phosphoribosylaminoimidazole carboxylase [Yamadazyma tenuis ATCC 10573]EGV64118.1 Phosphoribosylaminoimidazole carboxylase [Yamadazyma tenuis ATCC 10573]